MLTVWPYIFHKIFYVCYHKPSAKCVLVMQFWIVLDLIVLCNLHTLTSLVMFFYLKLMIGCVLTVLYFQCYHSIQRSHDYLLNQEQHLHCCFMEINCTGVCVSGKNHSVLTLLFEVYIPLVKKKKKERASLISVENGMDLDVLSPRVWIFSPQSLIERERDKQVERLPPNCSGISIE